MYAGQHGVLFCVPGVPFLLFVETPHRRSYTRRSACGAFLCVSEYFLLFAEEHRYHFLDEGNASLAGQQ